MAVGPSSGSKLFIGTTASNGASDTYTEIGQITNLGEFGRQYQEITFDALGSRDTLKFKGNRNDGTIQADLGRSPSDAGQALINAALNSDLDYNFKVTLNDASGTTGSTPTTFIMKAKVMSYTTNVGGPSNVVAARVALSIKTSSITETAAT